jgi:hypothetical protein
MGEQFGYLHKSTIGNKQGTGRNRLYILSRILSPHFKLYPESFAGYQFMDSATLKIALTDKARFLRAFERILKSQLRDSCTVCLSHMSSVEPFYRFLLNCCALIANPVP